MGVQEWDLQHAKGQESRLPDGSVRDGCLAIEKKMSQDVSVEESPGSWEGGLGQRSACEAAGFRAQEQDQENHLGLG